MQCRSTCVEFHAECCTLLSQCHNTVNITRLGGLTQFGIQCTLFLIRSRLTRSIPYVTHPQNHNGQPNKMFVIPFTMVMS